jgi:chromosome partitioning protein
MKLVISFANHKGGVGKTTSAVNIAAVLGEMGRRVLLVDLDPQGSASLHLGVRDKGSGFLRALESTVALPVIPTGVDGVDLIPSGPMLSAAAQRFSGVLGMELLERCLARTPGDWEIAIIDCPPGLGILTMGALRASRYLLVPIEASHLSLNGLYQLTETLTSMHRENHQPGILGIITCRANLRRRLHKELSADLESQFPGMIAPAVRESVALAEAPAHGQPITMYAPNSNGPEDYRRVAEWLMQRLC